MTEIERVWIDKYSKCGGLWLHDGNPKRPHALLTSGRHSNGFFNSGKVTEDPVLLEEACFDLAEKVRWFVKPSDVSRVVGPAFGAITLAHGLAGHLTKKRHDGNGKGNCLSAYAEKMVDDGVKKMVFSRATFRKEEWILPVEDVLTTGSSVEQMAQAIVDAGGNVLPFVAVLVNRSGLTEVNGKKIIALIERPMPMWLHEECELCKKGSTPVRPKENWAQLTAAYA